MTPPGAAPDLPRIARTFCIGNRAFERDHRVGHASRLIAFRLYQHIQDLGACTDKLFVAALTCCWKRNGDRPAPLGALSCRDDVPVASANHMLRH